MKKVNERLDKAYKAIRNEEFNKSEWLPKPWEVVRQPTKHGRIKDTGVPIAELKEIGKRITTFPSDLEVHKTIEKIYSGRVKSIETGKAIDFPTAESLAFATLVDEGFSVRLSGEDCERYFFYIFNFRGTFS
jgi:2-oxoglutarate dehydrogenase E1 component